MLVGDGDIEPPSRSVLASSLEGAVIDGNGVTCSCLDGDHKKPSFTGLSPVFKPLRRIENVPQPDSCTVFIQHTINSFPHLLV